MWLALAVLLTVVWAVSFAVFKVAGWAIHLLIIAAVITGIIHLFQWMRHRRTT